MAFIVSSNSNSGRKFEPAPEDTHEAVIVDIVDKGTKVQNYDGKEKTVRYVALVWEIDANIEETGRRFTVSKQYPLSLNIFTAPNGSVKKSKLREDLPKILGREITDAEARAFDLETLLGKPNRIVVEHNPDRQDPDKIWANVGSILKSKHPISPSGEYTRQIDRDRAKLNPAPAAGFTGKPTSPNTGAGQSAGGHKAGTQVAGPADYDPKNPAGVPVDESGEPIF